ncbi:MAG: hypothetical protein LAN64_12055 [Acidobacteriia bacterium]|nr:hypothetical protein [Terriglobia bacterium]
MSARNLILPSVSLTDWILGIVTAHLLAGICTHTVWLVTGNPSVLRYYFDYQGALILIIFSALEVVLSISAYRQFSSDQPLRLAWLFIILAAVCHFTGVILKHLLAVNSEMNPLHYLTQGWDTQLSDALRRWGGVIGGPTQMALLTCGLFLSLRLYRRCGMLAKPKAVDMVLIGAAMAYSLIVIHGIVVGMWSSTSPVTYGRALTWPNDYLLSVLLLEAIFLRRSALEMGWGYVSKVWSAFAAAIFLTSLCSLLNWLTAYGVLDWKQTAFSWYLWYPASAAFALAPAYQWEALRTAHARLADTVESPGLTAA